MFVARYIDDWLRSLAPRDALSGPMTRCELDADYGIGAARALVAADVVDESLFAGLAARFADRRRAIAHVASLFGADP